MKKSMSSGVLFVAAMFLSMSSVFGQWNNGTPGVQSTDNKVGIGTTAPVEQLEVVSGNRKVGLNYSIPGAAAQTGGILALSRISDGGKRMLLGMTATTADEAVIYGEGGATEMRFVSGGLGSQGFGFYMNVSAANAFAATRPTGPVMKIDGSGNVGIGTSAPDARLTVKGSIHAQEVRVDLTGSVAPPDYVFAPDYHLLPLSMVAQYIQENSHLPEVPSAREMEESGINLKEMNLLLLKKIEELTLYTIDINTKNQNDEAEIKQMREQMRKQNELIERQGKAIERLEARVR